MREGVELCRDCRGGVGRELSGVLVWAVRDFRPFLAVKINLSPFSPNSQEKIKPPRNAGT